MLTSHYMADVVALCERVIVIHHGKILFDGGLAALADTVAAWKTTNKWPVALYGAELAETARSEGVAFRAESQSCPEPRFSARLPTVWPERSRSAFGVFSMQQRTSS
jgi:ABC-type multidrug transport system ATPase subunit